MADVALNASQEPLPPASRGGSASSFRRLLESGFVFAAASFLVGLGNFAYQLIIKRQLGTEGEFGFVNTTLAFVAFLGLPLTIGTTAIAHYIARFSTGGEHARLQGLLAGCRKFLFRLTLVGSVLALALLKPLSLYFNIPRMSLMVIALVCVLASLWSSFASALCQGLAWFKRLAFIGLLGVFLRLAFGGLMTWKFQTAEVAVLATAVATLASLVLLFWRKELSHPAEPISPWDREFVQFLVVSAACVGGTYFFNQGDLLVVQHYCDPAKPSAWTKAALDAYTAAGLLARALPMVVSPMLTVLFTHRSGQQSHSAMGDHLKFLGLYAAGLLLGALSLLVLRNFCAHLLKAGPEMAAMLGRLGLTMVFAGLLQALGMWALASRWLKLSMLYGALGLAYWLSLLGFGHTPAALLGLMPVMAGAAFAVLFICWLLTTLRGSRQG